MRLSPEELRARKRRNLWIALGLVAFMVLIFSTTLLRMQQNQANERALLGQPAAGEAAAATQ